MQSSNDQSWRLHRYKVRSRSRPDPTQDRKNRRLLPGRNQAWKPPGPVFCNRSEGFTPMSTLAGRRGLTPQGLCKNLTCARQVAVSHLAKMLAFIQRFTHPVMRSVHRMQNKGRVASNSAASFKMLNFGRS